MGFQDLHSTLEDKLKAVSAVVGILAIITAAISYSITRASDSFFLAMVIISWIGTMALLAGRYFGYVKDTRLWKWVDLIYHGGMAVMLSIAWILCIINMFFIWNIFSGGLRATRFFAMMFLAMHTGIYGLIAFSTFKKIRGGPPAHDTVT